MARPVGVDLVGPRDPDHPALKRRRRLRVPGGIAFTFAPDGRLRAEAALGADEVRVGTDVLPLLAAFLAPRAPADVVREIAARAPARLTPAGVRRTIARLEAAGLLVDDARERDRGPLLAGAAFADLEVHRRLVMDVRRIERFGAAMAAAAPGKRVLEVGTGTGVLAVLAARAGARAVTAVEETGVAAIARDIVERNGVAAKVHVIERSSREIGVEALAGGRKAEVLAAEILGGDPLDERLLETVADARERLLVEGAAVIPRALAICAVAVEARDARFDAARRRAEVEEAMLALGIDLEPLRAALAGKRPPSFTAEVRDLEPAGGARGLSGEVSLARFDLEHDEPSMLRRAVAALDLEAIAPVLAPGLATALAVYFRADLGSGVTLTNAPFAPETHWGQLILPLAAPRPLGRARRVRFRGRIRGGTLDLDLA